MKRLIVMCLALTLALVPAVTAEAAQPKAAKSCAAAKKTAKGKRAKKSGKACAKKPKKATPKKATPEAVAAGRECRADRRLDPEGFATDFGTAPNALAKCVADLLDRRAAEEALVDEEEPLEDEPLADEPIEAPFTGEDVPAIEDDELA